MGSWTGQCEGRAEMMEEGLATHRDLQYNQDLDAVPSRGMSAGGETGAMTQVFKCFLLSLKGSLHIAHHKTSTKQCVLKQ